MTPADTALDRVRSPESVMKRDYMELINKNAAKVIITTEAKMTIPFSKARLSLELDSLKTA